MNVGVYYSAIRADLITSHETDLHLARLIEKNDSQIQEFVLEVLTECFLGKRAFCLYTEFLHSISSIRRLLSRKIMIPGYFLANPSAALLIQSIEDGMALNSLKDIAKYSDSENIELKKKIETVFAEWVETASHPGVGVETLVDMVTKVASILNPAFVVWHYELRKHICLFCQSLS